MGCNAIGRDSLASIDTGVVSLVATNQTDILIRKIEYMGDSFSLNTPLNFKGDTLLHYACAKNDARLVKYLLSKPEVIRTAKNHIGLSPK